MNTKMAKGCKERCEEANRSEAVDVLTTFWQIGKVLPNRFSLIASPTKTFSLIRKLSIYW